MALHMAWSAKQYVLFEDERTRPVRDLVSAIPCKDAQFAVDLGCGPGNSTEVLIERFPSAVVHGIDSSPDMIAAAQSRLPNVAFEVADLLQWVPPEGGADVILANAVMQWVPDHRDVFPGLVTKLSPGGCLAVQMPDNLDEPSHKAMREVARQAPWAERLTDAKRVNRKSAAWYYELLKPYCSSVDIWCTIYHHPLAGGPSAIVEWFKGTGLRPYLARLNDEEREDFLERYSKLVAQFYPALDDGSVLLPFPRIFIISKR